MNPNFTPTDKDSPVARTGPEPGRSQPPGSPGERRVVTVLFCDVTGSTAMAGQLDPEEWAELMDEAFDYLTAPVHRYEGTVARLMGEPSRFRR
jgi:class 3 adenylate cyclase